MRITRSRLAFLTGTGLFLLVCNGLLAEQKASDTPISLAGTWAFRLDHDGVGVDQKWFAADLPDKTKLPGSTDENHFGKPNTRPPDFQHLARLYEYTGPAWYQREVDIPAAWRGKRITLFLERCHWETRVWVDGQACGMQDSLCVPHVHDLSAVLTPGKHRLSIRVDNSFKVDVGNWAHSMTEETQTNWNGIVGRIELWATDPVWIEEVQVYPDLARKVARIQATIGNATGKPVRGRLTLKAVPFGSGSATAPKTVDFSVAPATADVSAELPMGANVALWDEFSPNLYELRATITGDASGAKFADTHTVRFGMRELTNGGGKQLTLNGRRYFVRGTLECCIFPLTGYPPTDEAAWLRILKIAKSYGLNHLRFHSWCPPEAAFAAADEMGFTFHVECPQWVGDVGKDPPRDAFITEELKRILDTYGNHPSFAFQCMGNELTGDPAFLQTLVRLGQERDRRHLYTPSTAWSHGAADDYRVCVIRGLHGPSTDADFRAEDAAQPVPVVSHEVGQWTVFPNLAEISKYTGITRARNFEIVREDLAKQGMLDQAAAFTQASGRFMVSLYKEEIEVLLRSPNHGGFQLLDLHDFPGQGTALVGTLDPFWDSKGLIKPEEWRRFCGPTVPLLRLNKRTFTGDETLSAAVEIAHYGAADIKGATPVWTIKDPQGREVASGTLPTASLKAGNLISLGKIETPLAKAATPTKLTVTVSLKGTDIGNDWDIWVYPATASTTPPADVTVSRAWDAATTSALAAGKKVLLLAAPGILTKSTRGTFLPPFWTPTWQGADPSSMSILCDPKHPALAQFPTEFHSNWQWYDLLQRSRSVILDDTPATYRPIVQVVDAFNRCHKLGNVFEAKVGPGKLLVCSINLWQDLPKRPVARQLLASLLAYAGSEAFAPQQELDKETLAKLFREKSALERLAGEPPDLDKAVLRVKAAMNVPERNKAFPWEPAADEVLAKQPGFGYSVNGGTWRDETGAAWHDGNNLEVTITCPKGFTGKLYARFHDWNRLGRLDEISFQGKDLGELAEYETGAWLAFPITAEDSKDGKLVLSAHPTVNNSMITEMAVVK